MQGKENANRPHLLKRTHESGQFRKFTISHTIKG